MLAIVLKTLRPHLRRSEVRNRREPPWIPGAHNRFSTRYPSGTDGAGVTFKWKDYRIKGRDRLKSMTLDVSGPVARNDLAASVIRVGNGRGLIVLHPGPGACRHGHGSHDAGG